METAVRRSPRSTRRPRTSRQQRQPGCTCTASPASTIPAQRRRGWTGSRLRGCSHRAQRRGGLPQRLEGRPVLGAGHGIPDEGLARMRTEEEGSAMAAIEEAPVLVVQAARHVEERRGDAVGRIYGGNEAAV
ncbi:hypothetical protein EJB05_12298 [Eragrostis curvula]|uniref:Uncharacterized protein n=1 Tax=Eragrostis curvula TaxID=38414 RepID=A0A5J9VR84_9POAL|nr:hypothetical protein EJB05_12298 [Eragrostis curvula]